MLEEIIILKKQSEKAEGLKKTGYKLLAYIIGIGLSIGDERYSS